MSIALASVISRLNPVVAPFVQRLIGRDSPETDVLQPAETVGVEPPAFLAGMLDRVTATDEHSTLDYHIGTALQTTVTHAPVLRHSWRNALVRRSGFATWRQRERYGKSLDLSELTGPIAEEPVLRYCQSVVSWRYFGHWLSNSLPTALIEPEHGALWMPHDPAWTHAPDYVSVFSLPVLPDQPVFAHRLITYQDYSQGSHKSHRYSQLHDRIQSRFGGTGKAQVYLRRGRTGAPRHIVNEDALVEALAARDWHILDVVGTSVEEIQRTLCPASVVVSIDGSHINHAHLALRPGSTMVVLVPQDRFTLQHIGLSRGHGFKPGFVVLKGSLAAGFTADPDEILRTVDLALAMRA